MMCDGTLSNACPDDTLRYGGVEPIFGQKLTQFIIHAYGKTKCLCDRCRSLQGAEKRRAEYGVNPRPRENIHDRVRLHKAFVGERWVHPVLVSVTVSHY